MLKHLAAVFAIIIAGGIAVAAVKPTEQIFPTSMVKVKVAGGHGSGFYIGRDMVITAQHVTAGAKGGKVSLLTRDGQTVDGEVLWSSEKFDVAAIRAHLPASVYPSYLSCTVPQRGEEITISGNPFVAEDITVWGHIAGKHQSAGRWASVVPVNAAVVQGQSGGPLYDRGGSVIAMIVGTMMIPVGMGGSLTGIGVAVPGRTICELMGRA